MRNLVCKLLQPAHNFHKSSRQNLSCPRNPSGELNKTGNTVWVCKKVCRQLRHMSSLAFDLEQDIRWSRKKVVRRIADDAERKQGNTKLGARASDEVRLHVHCACSRCACQLHSFFTGIN